MTAKAPLDHLNYAMDNGHEKKPEAKKQYDRTHALMDTENESPINETPQDRTGQRQHKQRRAYE